MDHPQFVSVLQPQSHLANVLAGFLNVQLPLTLDDGRQIDPLDVFHYQEMRVLHAVGIVGDNNVQIVQVCGGLNLPVKPLDHGRVAHPLFGEHFDRDNPPQSRLFGLEDDAHSALTKHVQQLVLPQIESIPPGHQHLHMPAGQQPLVDQPPSQRLGLNCRANPLNVLANVTQRVLVQQIALLQTLEE